MTFGQCQLGTSFWAAFTFDDVLKLDMDPLITLVVVYCTTTSWYDTTMKSSDQRVKEGVASRISPHTLERLHSAHTSFDDEAYWKQHYFVWTQSNRPVVVWRFIAVWYKTSRQNILNHITILLFLRCLIRIDPWIVVVSFDLIGQTQKLSIWKSALALFVSWNWYQKYDFTVLVSLEEMENDIDKNHDYKRNSKLPLLSIMSLFNIEIRKSSKCLVVSAFKLSMALFFTYDNSLVQWWFHSMFVVGSRYLDQPTILSECELYLLLLVYILSGTRPVDFFTRFVFAVKPQQLRSRLVLGV